MDRPTFYVDSDVKKPVRASGIVPYTYLNCVLHVLLLETMWPDTKEPYFEDFGGKTDRRDKNSYDTACRECEEESNNILNLRTKKPTHRYYFPAGKYLCYLVPVQGKMEDFRMERLGKAGDDSISKASWISVKDLSKINLHQRLNWLNTYFKLP